MHNAPPTLFILGLGKGAELGAGVALELDGVTYCPLHDHRGNIIALVDAQTGHIAESYRYTAFGECETYNDKQQQIEKTALSNPWGYASKRLDPETGFVYFSRRYYAPTTGRWITPDPLGFADGPNMYAYVHGNPMTHFDLFGLLDEEDDAYDSAGMYGMLEVSVRTGIEFTSWGAYIVKGRDGYAYCQNWHNDLDDFGERYVQLVSGMPGSNATAKQLHQAVDTGALARDTFDFMRLATRLAKQAISKC